MADDRDFDSYRITLENVSLLAEQLKHKAISPHILELLTHDLNNLKIIMQHQSSDQNQMMIGEQLLSTNNRIQEFASSTFRYLLDPKLYFRLYNYTLDKDNHKLHNSTNFTKNNDHAIHRWTPYIQGFSGNFVRQILNDLHLSSGSTVVDPFMGSGTVAVEAKQLGIDVYGSELNPFLHFVAKTKTNWAIDISAFRVEAKTFLKQIKTVLSDIQNLKTLEQPEIFLRNTSRHFDPDIGKVLWHIRQLLPQFRSGDFYDLLKLVFTSSLIPLSNMTRNPSLGYNNSHKQVHVSQIVPLMDQKIEDICQDLRQIQQITHGYSQIDLQNAKSATYGDQEIDAIITSPPYMNGMDYVNNYKLELVWGDFSQNYAELRNLKQDLIVCDNSSRSEIRQFQKQPGLDYYDPILEDILHRIDRAIAERKKPYRRPDQSGIVRKYFVEMYEIFKNILPQLRTGGKMVLVVGDSLISDVYLPTDLLLNRMAEMYFDMTVERIIQTRRRRSGQRVSFKLRETVSVLEK